MRQSNFNRIRESENLRLIWERCFSLLTILISQNFLQLELRCELFLFLMFRMERRNCARRYWARAAACEGAPKWSLLGLARRSSQCTEGRSPILALPLLSGTLFSTLSLIHNFLFHIQQIFSHILIQISIGYFYALRKIFLVFWLLMNYTHGNINVIHRYSGILPSTVVNSKPYFGWLLRNRFLDSRFYILYVLLKIIVQYCKASFCILLMTLCFIAFVVKSYITMHSVGKRKENIHT